MKKSTSKLLSLLLCLSLLLSAFAVFASADEGSDEEVEETDYFRLLYNRDFEEGWGVVNGNSLVEKNNLFKIDYETDFTYNYNYFLRVQLTSSQDGYLEYSLDNNSHVGTVIEFDIKCDDACNMGRIMYMRSTGGNGVGTAVNMLHINNNQLIPLEDNASAITIENKWIHCAFVIDYTLTDAEGKLSTTDFSVTAYVGDKVVTKTYNTPINGADILRIGTPAGRPVTDFDSSFCIDNLQMYNGRNECVEITEDMGYGYKINPDMNTTVEILGKAENEKTNGAYIAESLAMKIGVDFLSYKGERRPIALLDENDNDTAYGAPIVVDGNIMVPLDAVLEYIGYPSYVHPDGEYIDITTGYSASYISIGKTTATVDGARVELECAPGYATAENGGRYLVIGMNDVESLFPGYYVTYDDMGLIIICEKDNVVDRYTGLGTMLDVMKTFVFEYLTPEKAYEDVKENTNNFDHPYILTNQEELDMLHAVYTAEEGDENYDPELKSYLARLVSTAETRYKNYALPSGKDDAGRNTYETFVGFNTDKTPVMPYVESGGYDPDGGRSSPGTYTGHLQDFAIGYAITRDEKYVHCAYPIAIAMGEWLHWGPGHFLNCADASAPYAVYYDWCYDVNEQLGYDNDKLAEILFNQGVHQGYLSTTGQPSPFYRKQGDASNYTDRDNNWNAVCTSGMVMAAYAIFDHDQYVPEGSYIVASNLKTLTDVGMVQYAPDGSYVEGTGYWDYGTNTFFRLTSTLLTAAGRDYGLMDCWGIDTTCYFAAFTESSDFKTFNFADGGMGTQNTYWFMFVGQYFGDSNLVDIRMTQLRNGKSISIYDVLNYPTEEYAKANITLDYKSDALELFTTRSSWEKGAIFAGLICGENNASHHNQIDGGAFVYHAGGNVWFMDIGTEDYNTSGFWGSATRYRYYVMKPEGNNTLALTTNESLIPYGQVLNSNGFGLDYQSNEYGALSVFDNTEYFGGLASYWRRGMMLTNDRSTVVLQDEVSFKNIETVYWFAHYGLSYVSSVELSADGRTAYLYGKSGGTLRVSIVSKSLDFKFEIMDCYTFVHLNETTGTFSPDYALTHGTFVPEKSRDNYRKLAIKAENVLSFNVAVVIELVDPANESEVGYEWTDMENWTPGADQRGDIVADTLKRKAAKKTDITGGVNKLKRTFEDGNALNDRFDNTYRTLCDIQYTIIFFGDELGSSYDSSVDQYMDYLDIFNKYINTANANSDKAIGITGSIMGVK